MMIQLIFCYSCYLKIQFWIFLVLHVRVGVLKRKEHKNMEKSNYYAIHWLTMIWIGAINAIFLGLGIACIVVSSKYPDVTCGTQGLPPLIKWVYGTGISYTAISSIMIICLIIVAILRKSKYGQHLETGYKINILLAIPGSLYIISSLFMFSWVIVGSVSIWRDGQDCSSYLPVWHVSMATIITQFVIYGIVALFICCVSMCDSMNDWYD